VTLDHLGPYPLPSSPPFPSHPIHLIFFLEIHHVIIIIYAKFQSHVRHDVCQLFPGCPLVCITIRQTRRCDCSMLPLTTTNSSRQPPDPSGQQCTLCTCVAPCVAHNVRAPWYQILSVQSGRLYSACACCACVGFAAARCVQGGHDCQLLCVVGTVEQPLTWSGRAEMGLEAADAWPAVTSDILSAMHRGVCMSLSG
jgi:hypothetical protein